MSIFTGEKDAAALKKWRRESGLSRHTAASDLGITDAELRYFETGARPVPHIVMLAARACAAGLDDSMFDKLARRVRWNRVVKNSTEYAAGIKEEVRQLPNTVGEWLGGEEHDDFIEFVAMGPDPALARTDVTLLANLTAVATHARASGFCAPPAFNELGRPYFYMSSIGGNCPLQAEGRVDDKQFYFRARGARWTLNIGSDPVTDPEWSYEETYGEGYEAGWMGEDDARIGIAKAVAAYRKEKSDTACTSDGLLKL